MMRVLTQLAYACLISLRAMQRDLAIVVAFFLVFPLGFLFFLTRLVPSGSLSIILVGSVMMEAALINVNVLPQSLANDKATHIYELWVSLPISPATFVAGSALPWLPVSLAISAFTLFIGVTLFGIAVPVSALLILGALFLVWTSTMGLGFLVAVYGGRPRQVNQLAGFMGIIMTFFAPIFYPIADLPVDLRYVAYLWPPTWGALLLQGLFASNIPQSALAAGVLALFSIGGLIIIGLGLRWREP